MKTTTTRPASHAVGIVAVLLTAILAVIASPAWLLATGLLATVNLARYTVPVWQTGRIDVTVIPLAIVNMALLAAGIPFAVTPQ